MYMYMAKDILGELEIAILESGKISTLILNNLATLFGDLIEREC